MKKVVVCALLVLGLGVEGFASPVLEKGDFASKLKKASGKQGQFVVGKDNFPKSYFLVPQNLPFLVGLSIYHPKSSTLGLSKEQIKKIEDVRDSTVPAILKKARKIKDMELKLAQNIAIDTNTAESQYDLVDEISKLRTELTKAHLSCITHMREILSKEQYKKLLVYATKMGK